MRTYRRVNYQDRCQILAFLQAKVGIGKIAERLGFDKSTIYREISRNSSEQGYEAQKAETLARKRYERCSRHRLIREDTEGLILSYLFCDFSPEQISGRLRLEGMFCPSHQTIYRYIHRHYRELRPFLRRYNRRGASRIRMKIHKSEKKTLIDYRPEAANQRQRIGDWERDCMYGAVGKRILVCVDRKSRFLKLARVKEASVRSVNALTSTLLSSTQKPIYSITNDNGPEFRYSTGLAAPVFYCHPRKPQQRGTVENSIGLLRQYIKRKTNLDEITDQDLSAIENAINFRPRKSLDYRTPHEVFYETTVALAM